MRFLTRCLVLVVTALVMAVAPVQAAGTVTLKLSPQAQLVDDGEAVLVAVRARCQSGTDVLEAFVYVVQDEHTSQFAFFPATCDGHQHRFVVRVPADTAPFHGGEARLSGYLLVGDASGSSDSPTRIVQIQDDAVD